VGRAGGVDEFPNTFYAFIFAQKRGKSKDFFLEEMADYGMIK